MIVLGIGFNGVRVSFFFISYTKRIINVLVTIAKTEVNVGHDLFTLNLSDAVKFYVLHASADRFELIIFINIFSKSQK